MEKKSWKKTMILFAIVLALILVAFMITTIIIMRNHAPIYGVFEYVNEDGTVARIELSEESVYFENVDYYGLEAVEAFSKAGNELSATDKKVSMEQLEEKREEYMKEWDFEKAFDRKISKIDFSKYIEADEEMEDSEGAYSYEIYYPGEDSYGLMLYVDLYSKTLSLGDKEFVYKGK